MSQALATGTSPSGRSTPTFQKGQGDADTDGKFWHRAAGGTLGIWRNMSDSTAAGAFHVIAPARVFAVAPHNPDTA